MDQGGFGGFGFPPFEPMILSCTNTVTIYTCVGSNNFHAGTGARSGQVAEARHQFPASELKFLAARPGNLKMRYAHAFFLVI